MDNSLSSFPIGERRLSLGVNTNLVNTPQQQALQSKQEGNPTSCKACGGTDRVTKTSKKCPQLKPKLSNNAGPSLNITQQVNVNIVSSISSTATPLSCQILPSNTVAKTNSSSFDRMMTTKDVRMQLK